MLFQFALISCWEFCINSSPFSGIQNCEILKIHVYHYTSMAFTLIVNMLAYLWFQIITDHNKNFVLFGPLELVLKVGICHYTGFFFPSLIARCWKWGFVVSLLSEYLTLWCSSTYRHDCSRYSNGRLCNSNNNGHHFWKLIVMEIKCENKKYALKSKSFAIFWCIEFDCVKIAL
jgi:hypothetical protein